MGSIFSFLDNDSASDLKSNSASGTASDLKSNSASGTASDLKHGPPSDLKHGPPSDLKHDPPSNPPSGQKPGPASIEMSNLNPGPNPDPNPDTDPDTDLKFTDDYGTPYFISFLSAIYCRLAYMNSRDFLNVYTQVFGKIIPNELMTDMNTAVLTNGIKVLIDDTAMFNLTDPNTKKYGMKVFRNSNVSLKLGLKLGLKFLPLSAKINKVLGDQRKSPTNANCTINNGDPPIADENLVFVNITNSNYGEIYIIGDKRMPNIVIVSFRGTASLKSVGSYLRGSSITPTTIYDKGDIKIKVLQGIYKILNENINVIMNAIEYVANKINNSLVPGSIKIITTGHSLGGALATLFAFKYTFFLKYRKGREWLDPNIGCFTLGSPRVLGTDAASVFCSLVEQNKASFDSWPDKTIQKLLIYFKKNIPDHGWITYLRITTYNDPIPALPPSAKLITYSHPCSDNGEEYRSKISQDCLLLVQEPFSKRCMTKTKKKLVHTNKYDEPMKCVSKKRTMSLKASETGKFFANRMVYHTQYLGISFAGVLSVSGFIQTMLVGRLKAIIGLKDNIKSVEGDIKPKKGDTVTRLIFYPTVNDDYTKVNIFFYDLSLYRDLESDDQAIADERASELASGTDIGIEMIGSSITHVTPTEPTASITPVTQNSGIKSLPEDIKITMSIFNAMVEYIKNNNLPTENPVYAQMNTISSMKFDIIGTDPIPTNYVTPPVTEGGKTKRRNRKARVNKRNTKRIRIPRAIKLHKKQPLKYL